jgi:hypothetical protein
MDEEEELEPAEDNMNYELSEAVFTEAVDNSYMILTEELTFDELLSDTHTLVLAHDPTKGPELIELKTILEHYVVTEDYDRCIKVRDIMNEKFPKSIIQKV